MTDQEKAIAELNVSCAVAAKLVTALRFKGEAIAADKVAEKREEIIRLAEDLEAKALEEWVAGTATITADIAAANQAIKVAIKDIKKNVKTAEQIVKAAEKLDGIVEKAVKYIS